MFSKTILELNQDYKIREESISNLTDTELVTRYTELLSIRSSAFDMELCVFCISYIEHLIHCMSFEMVQRFIEKCTVCH